MGSRAELLETLRKAASSLREVEERKMFGCEALFTSGAIFALVWKTGRIGVKLPDEARFGELSKQKGAEPWKAGPMVMAHWLLVPPALEDAKRLAPWVKEAHAMAAAGLGKLKVEKKIRSVKKKKRETSMAAKKKGNESAIASAGDALANTPQAARTVAEEVVRAVTKVAKAAAGAAKAVVGKGKKKAGAAKKKAGAAKKKAGGAAKKASGAAKKAGKAVKKVAADAKKVVAKAKKTAKKK